MTDKHIPIEVVESDKLGSYLLATEDIRNGTVICKEKAELSSTMLLSTISYKKGLNVNLPIDGYIWRTPHKCDPNAYLLVQSENETDNEGDLGSVSLVARKDIKKGELVGYDYNTTEVYLSRGFHCACGAKKCNENIRGFHYMGSESQRELVEKVGLNTLSPAVIDAWNHGK